MGKKKQQTFIAKSAICRALGIGLVGLAFVAGPCRVFRRVVAVAGHDLPFDFFAAGRDDPRGVVVGCDRFLDVEM